MSDAVFACLTKMCSILDVSLIWKCFSLNPLTHELVYIMFLNLFLQSKYTVVEA